MPRPAPIDYEKMATLQRRNLSAQQISEQLGCHTRTVTRWRARSGLSQPTSVNGGRPLSPERKRAVEEMINDGASFNDIIDTLHVTGETIRRHFPGRGWTPAQGSAKAHLTRALNRLPDSLQ